MRKWARFVCLVGVWVATASQARAHDGPPFPIVMDQAAGPYLVSIWTDPDIGTGQFWVILAPAPGTALPDDITIHLCVQPLSGRLAEACYQAHRDGVQDRVQYYCETEFDQGDMWRVRVRIESAGKAVEVLSEVESTPPGYGRWDLLIYSFPFILFGGLLVIGLLRRRGRFGDGQEPPTASGSLDQPT